LSFGIAIIVISIIDYKRKIKWRSLNCAPG
jgi:hypothetical protein